MLNIYIGVNYDRGWNYQRSVQIMTEYSLLLYHNYSFHVQNKTNKVCGFYKTKFRGFSKLTGRTGNRILSEANF